MLIITMMWLIWKLTEVNCETPYHYINQVPGQAKPEVLSPKPLFAPHDVRREGSGSTSTYPFRGGYNRELSNLPRYGTEHHLRTGGSLGQSLLYDNNHPSNVYGGDQQIWYPTESGESYPELVAVDPIYQLPYGPLPAGYEPVIPLRGNPTGYSYSYNAGDHSRHEVSDGRGNYYSSFSFVPPSGGDGVQSKFPSTLDFGIFSTSRPSLVDRGPSIIGSYSTQRPILIAPYPSTLRPILHPPNPSTSRPILPEYTSLRPVPTPTARPLVGALPDQTNIDFSNGFNFVANNYPTSRPLQKPITFNSHALSTNIQYDSLPGESSSQATVAPLRSRVVTVEHPVTASASRTTSGRSYQEISRSVPLAFSSRQITTEASSFPDDLSSRGTSSRRFTVEASDSSLPGRVTTQRSYQEISRSRPLAFSSRRITTEDPISAASVFTPEVTRSPFSLRRIVTKSKPLSQTLRGDQIRSTTERPKKYVSPQFSITIIPSELSTKKPSVVQKIPRKSKNKNITSNSGDYDSRPMFIDDLTSLGYSKDAIGPNNEAIQNLRRDKSIQFKLPRTVDFKKLTIIPDYQTNSSRTFDAISKDNHIVGNTTYLAGLGLNSNIHY